MNWFIEVEFRLLRKDGTFIAQKHWNQFIKFENDGCQPLCLHLENLDFQVAVQFMIQNDFFDIFPLQFEINELVSENC